MALWNLKANRCLPHLEKYLLYFSAGKNLRRLICKEFYHP